jgi:hypothetical protein
MARPKNVNTRHPLESKSKDLHDSRKGGTKYFQLTMRVPPDLKSFIDSEVERVAEENPGLVVTTADIVRMALQRMKTARGGGVER